MKIGVERTQPGRRLWAVHDLDLTQPDAWAPIRYLTIRVWLAGIECNSIN